MYRLLHHPMCCEVTSTQRTFLGPKEVKIAVVPNLVNTVHGITSPVLNPEYVSRNEGL